MTDLLLTGSQPELVAWLLEKLFREAGQRGVVMLAAIDGDENGIRRALTGLTVSDLVDLAGELSGLGTAVWRTSGASREALRESLQVYALQLAVELPSRPQRGAPARTRTSHVISGAPPTFPIHPGTFKPSTAILGHRP